MRSARPQGPSFTPARRNPFPGTRSYTEEDSTFFYGHAREEADLRQAVLDSNFVLLEGPAKVGKTSLVCAGLIPKVRSMRPTAIARIVYRDVGRDGMALPEWAQAPRSRARSSSKDGGFDLIVLDGVDSVREAQSNVLPEIHKLAGSVDRSLHLLVVWRGVLPRNEYQAAVQEWSGNHFRKIVLPALMDSALWEAINGPAKAAGQLLENGLTERLMESSGKAKSAIFQIQIVLSAMWGERRRGWLTNRSLDALGHLGGVFQEHMTRVLSLLTDADRSTAMNLFRALTEVDDRGWSPLTLSWNEVCSIPSISRCGAERIRDALAAAGLIDLWREEAAEAGVHVSLVRPNAEHYFNDEERVADEDFMRWRSQLNFAARQWQASGESVDALLPLEAVEEAKDWLDARRDAMTARESSFIEESIKAVGRSRCAGPP